MWVFHSCVCKIGITKTTTSERNPSSIKQSWIRFCAWVRPWLTRKSPKSYKEPWDCWEEASCAAANQIHSAIQWSVQRDRGRDREKALFRGQLLDGLECCYTSKPHHHCPWLQDSLTNELSVLFYFKKRFSSFYSTAIKMCITQILKPLIFIKAAQPKWNWKLQHKQELDSYRSGVSAGRYTHHHFHSCSS